MKKKICVVTGSRAEYHLLYWLLKYIQKSSFLELQIIATGMHLSFEYGYTIQGIESDGFHVDKKVDMQLVSNTSQGITKSMGLGMMGCADALADLKPDIMLVLGDRYEIYAACIAAMMAKIPIYIPRRCPYIHREDPHTYTAKIPIHTPSDFAAIKQWYY